MKHSTQVFIVLIACIAILAAIAFGGLKLDKVIGHQQCDALGKTETVKFVEYDAYTWDCRVQKDGKWVSADFTKQK